MNHCSFIVNNIKLYSEQVLVEHNEMPIMFVCVDKEKCNRYVALCTNLNEENYILIHVKTSTLIDMLRKRISMRDLFLNQSYFWDVQTAEVIEEDIVQKKSIEQIPTNVLPFANALFEIACEEHVEYANVLEDLLFL